MKMTPTRRRKWLVIGLRVQSLSVLWTLLEAVLGVLAVVLAGGLAMSAFSVDSGIELVSGFVLLTRLWLEWQSDEDALSQTVERLAAGVVGVALFALAAYIALKSGQALALHRPVEMSWLGLGVAAVAAVVSPVLAMAKRRIGRALQSAALLGDAACSMTCAYMAWVLLGGMILQWLFGFWWVDPVAAVGILYFILHEAWEAVEGALHGGPHVHGHAHGHAHDSDIADDHFS